VKNKTMSDIKISVGITLFTNPDYIFEAIDSLINQSEDAWEGILLLDKGASIKTIQIFDNFNHSKFKKFKSPIHLGPEQARAKAIELATTNWYFQLDSDDVLPVNAISDVLNAIKKSPKAEFIYGSTLHFSKESYYVMPPSNDPEVLVTSSLFSSMLPIKISMYNRLGGYSKKLKYFAADWDFWLSVYEKKILGADTDTVLYHRRNHNNNVINRNIEQWPEVLTKIINRHPKFFNFNHRKRKARYHVFERLARHYRTIRERNKAAYYAKIALENGNETVTLLEILKEQKMSKIRYFLRYIGKLL
tara:strand:+ start:1045 stop:1956 length:912 start_codon:yes stop_codon:yes gene_type:complete